MNLTENIHSAFHVLDRNRVRSFLTMLGIVIGVMGVIVIISAGNGAQSMIVNQIKSIGSNLIGVFPGSGEEEGPPVSVMGIVITTLKYDDILAIKESGRVSYIEAVSGYVRGTDTVSWGGRKTDTTFVGVSSELPIVEDTGVEIGDFFTKEDERSLQKVAVLGSDVKRDLFEDHDPIGELVKMGKQNFRVIGVMRERGATGFNNQDNQIFVPITTAQKLLLGINYISFARVKVIEEQYLDQAIEDIGALLSERHDIGIGEITDFDIRNQKDALNVLLSVTDAIKLFLAAIAAIALLVGGIGIMNIMLVAVQERVREIGLRKAVGAKSNDILTQFLVETIFITSVAGVMGIVLGIIISYLISKVAQLLGYEWVFSISMFAIILSVAVSSFIGLIFGLLPARRASRLDPINALHYE